MDFCPETQAVGGPVGERRKDRRARVCGLIAPLLLEGKLVPGIPGMMDFFPLILCTYLFIPFYFKVSFTYNRIPPFVFISSSVDKQAVL